MRKPDFFIVGAPKCGTTAMARYLERHPDIIMPAPKEIHFFGKDLQFTFPRITSGEYLSLFSTVTCEKRIGEGSVWYLYSREAAREIKDFNPFARIIVMLRNPVDMMYSLYRQRLYNGNEDIEDFGAALAAEIDRRHGRRLPSNVSNLMGCYYRDSARFTEQVRRYFHVFGKERVHIIFFDDLQSDTPGVYRETCKFLDVNASFEPDFRIINRVKRARSTRLRNLLRAPPPGVGRVLKNLHLNLTRRGGYKGWLRRLNESYANVPPMDQELREALIREFMPEVHSLSELLGRDLTSWCKTESQRLGLQSRSSLHGTYRLFWILPSAASLVF